MTIRIILVGCGNMGYAMLAGWLKAGRLTADQIFVVEPNDGLRARAETLGVRAASAAEGISADAVPLLVILAVKPQVIREVTGAYTRFAGGNTAFLSIAAGTQIRTFEEILGAQTPILRCMPNTPAAIGMGMMVVCANSRVSEETLRVVDELLSTSGEVATVTDESLMDAVTAVSGSGPAYVFHFIECLTAAAEAAGLPSDTAKLLAMQTVHGAASLARESAEEPAELRRQVTSPNGTTAAALAVLMGEDRLKRLVGEAVEAARRRSVELGA